MDISEIDARKKDLRDELKRLRASLGQEARDAIDAQIADNVAALPEWKRAQLVLTYLSVGDEVDTRALVERAWFEGKTVAVPRVVPRAHQMDWYRIEDFEHLETSSFGVDEPVADPANLLSLSDEGVFGIPMIALVPGLTFDRFGYRLGYGGGYYDRLLAAFTGDAVGLCRQVQLSDDLDARGLVGTHDQRVPLVVTESEVIYPEGGTVV